MQVTPARFAPNHKPPPGYMVEFWESDDHWHWRWGELTSVEFESKWTARRAAWEHYEQRLRNGARW